MMKLLLWPIAELLATLGGWFIEASLWLDEVFRLGVWGPTEELMQALGDLVKEQSEQSPEPKEPDSEPPPPDSVS